VFPFKEFSGWVQDLKKYKIRQRHATKYVSSNGNATFVERVRAAELFQKQTVAVIPAYNPDHVTYTDHTVFEYHIDIR
jgi:hypothetical protein